MRPTVNSKHKAAQDKIKADMDAYEAAGGPVHKYSTTERARPPVDHWDDRVTEDYRTHHDQKAARRLNRERR